MQVEYVVSDEDYITFVNSLPASKRLRRAGAFAATIAILGIIASVLLGAAPPIASLFVLAVGVAIYFVPVFTTKRSLKNLTEQERKMHLHFTEDGFQIESGMGESQMDWSAIDRVEETSTTILIHPVDSLPIGVPKRVLDSDAVVELMSFLVAHISLRPKGRNFGVTLILWFILLSVFAVSYYFLRK